MTRACCGPASAAWPRSPRCLALGAGLGALVTPAASRRLGLARWPVILLALATVTMVTLWLPYRLALILAGVFVLAFVAQGVKVCVDTVLQRTIDDQYRGRVFTVYDTMFNVAFVASAVATALTIPESGRAPVSIFILAALYAVAGLGYWWASSRVPVRRVARGVPGPELGLRPLRAERSLIHPQVEQVLVGLADDPARAGSPAAP